MAKSFQPFPIIHNFFKMQKKEIGYYDFRYFQSNHGHAHVSLYIYNFSDELGYFLLTLSNSSGIDVILQKLKQVIEHDESIVINGDQEAYMIASKHAIEIIVTLPGYEPFCIDTIAFFDVLLEYRKFVFKYESCQIPGIIPTSKLDTWLCVPNEYVKPEYWDLLKQQQQQESKE